MREFKLVSHYDLSNDGQLSRSRQLLTEKVRPGGSACDAFAWSAAEAAGREEQQRFWKAIARGLSSEDAAVTTCERVAARGWSLVGREGGGMPPISLQRPDRLRYLSLGGAGRVAIGRAQGAGVRDMARRLRRSAPSTVSRGCVATRRLGAAVWPYRASTAQWHSARRATRPKIAKPGRERSAEELRAGDREGRHSDG